MEETHYLILKRDDLVLSYLEFEAESKHPEEVEKILQQAIQKLKWHEKDLSKSDPILESKSI